MKNQDFNRKILDYLYGEMTPGERMAFEQRMEHDIELRLEFDALNEVRTRLSELSDKEVMEPFSVWGKTVSRSGQKTFTVHGIPWFSQVAAIAASLLILMFVAYLTNFSISINKNGLQLGYGQKATESEKKLREDEIRDIVAQAISQNNELMWAKLGATESSFQIQLADLHDSITKELNIDKNASVTPYELQNFLTEVDKRNSEMVKGYLKITSAQQQEYFKTMLTQFNQFMQEQRNTDLVMIQNNLVELKQTQTIQKKETDQVLASLITTVNYKSKN